MDPSNSKEILKDLLMKLIEGERDIELNRKFLSEQFTFNPTLLYQSLSKTSSLGITPRDLKDFLEDSKITESDEGIYMVVRQYSALQNGRLSLEDFLHFVLPSTDEFLAIRASSRSYPRDLDEKVKFHFCTLLKAEISLQVELESLKVLMFKSSDFSLWRTFEMINTSKSGHINEEEIKSFLKEFKRFINREDYDALMRRIDLQDDLLISYNEFLEALIPMQMPGNDENRVKTLEAEEKKSEIQNSAQKNPENEEIFESLPNDEQVDEPLDSQELEMSPKFQDEKEFTLSQQYETPIKTKDTGKVMKKNQTTVDKMRSLMIKELEYEKKYELLRETIIMRRNFSISKLFELIDAEGNGEINMLDFEKFLVSLNVEISRNVILLIFRRFSRQEDVLSLNDLISVFLCQQEEYFERLSDPESSDDLSLETLDKIQEFFSLFIEQEGEVLDQKRAFGLKPLELESLFGSLDSDNDGEIGVDDLKTFYHDAGLFVARKDIAMVLSRYSQEALDLDQFLRNFQVQLD
jgi:Ca2+-binding EF-hand superfamily protein